jgi:hypothetical protein
MAQTLKFGNGTWATKKDSILAYNDQNENYKPLPFNYTGAGKGTRVNKEGLIEVVENDRPRIDYTDSEDGVFLLEKAATNKIAYSEDFSELSTGGNMTIESGFLAPDGTLNARKITCTDNTGLISVGGVLANDTRTIYAKTVSGTGTAQLLSHNSNTNNVFTITEEWQRFELNSTPSVASNFYVIDFRDTAQTLTEVILWGAQSEANTHATSYIPTQGTIQTRVAETASGSGNSEVFNDSEGVLFADIAGLTNNDDVRIISISDGTNDNRVYIGLNSGLNSDPNKLYFYLNIGGTFVMGFVDIVLNQTEYNKIALTYKSGQSSIYLNGFLVNLDDTTFSNGNLNRLDFKNRGTGNPFYGKTKEIAYYDTVLTDLELETLTSYRSWLSMVKELNLNVIYNG